MKSCLTKCILCYHWIRFQGITNSVFVHGSNPEDVFISFDNFGGCNDALFQIFRHHRPHNAACFTLFHYVVSDFGTTIIRWGLPEKSHLFSSDSLKFNWSTWWSWFVCQWKNKTICLVILKGYYLKLLSFRPTKHDVGLYLVPTKDLYSDGG